MTEPMASKASAGLSDLEFTALRGWLRGGALTFSQHPSLLHLFTLVGKYMQFSMIYSTYALLRT